MISYNIKKQQMMINKIELINQLIVILPKVLKASSKKPIYLYSNE